MGETDRVENVIERDWYLHFDGRLIGADGSCGAVVVTKKELFQFVLARPVTGQLQLCRRQRAHRTDTTAAITAAAARQHLCVTDKLQKMKT